MRREKCRNSNQKLVLSIFLLFSICFLPGCDAYQKITGALSKYSVNTAGNFAGDGGLNLRISPKGTEESEKVITEGNITLQMAQPLQSALTKIPALKKYEPALRNNPNTAQALEGNPYLSISTSKTGASYDIGLPLVGVNPYLNHPGVNFETGITLGTTGPGAYVQGGYISKGSNIGIIGTQSWGSGKPESSVSLQKQVGNGVASLNYYEGGGLGVGYKMPFNF